MTQSRMLTTTALMGALVCLMTTFLHLPVPIAQGYVHLGDVAVLLGALLLGRRGAAAAAVGGALADVLSGFLLYAPVTALIKALMALCAGSMTRLDAPLWRTALVFALSGMLMTGGYWLFEWPVYGLVAAVSALAPNLLQGVCSAAIAVSLVPLMRRIAPHLRLSQ